MKKPLILVSNDDGVQSPGIQLLAKSLKKVGDVYIIAPDRERSAASHSLTLYRPLRVTKISRKSWSVDGTPTDCVNLAINGILPRRPALVVSGINRGGNLGDDVTYSGTVAASMEATLLAVPSFAVSLVSRRKFRFEYAAQFSVRIASHILEHGLPSDTLLNVNVPSRDNIKGCRVTRLGKRVYDNAVIEKTDPRGGKYYWIGGDSLKWEGGKDTDFYSVSKGYISVTPLHLDLTNYDSMEGISGIPVF